MLKIELKPLHNTKLLQSSYITPTSRLSILNCDEYQIDQLNDKIIYQTTKNIIHITASGRLGIAWHFVMVFKHVSISEGKDYILNKNQIIYVAPWCLLSKHIFITLYFGGFLKIWNRFVDYFFTALKIMFYLSGYSGT